MWMFLSCINQYDPSVSSGIWVQSDFRFDFNDECLKDTVLTDSLDLSYQFGDYFDLESVVRLSNFGNHEPDLISSYVNDLWGFCEGSQDSPRFTCPLPLAYAHYSVWKDDFPVQKMSEETGCEVVFQYGSTEGLFLDRATIMVSSRLRAMCVREGSSDSSTVIEYEEDARCSGTFVSTLDKQES